MPLAIASTEVVLFAITSAIRLGNQVRQSFVNNLQSEKLTIPLPNVDMSVDNFQITDFFTAHEHHQKENARLKELVTAQQERNLTDAETKEYKNFFEIAYCKENQDANAEIKGEELGALLRFRQWAKDEDAPPSGLRLIAGSLVELGIDYFQQVPGALNENSSNAESVKGLLNALDAVDFTSGNLKEALYKEVAPTLFSSAIETIQRFAPEISTDEKVQGFIQTATTGFVEDISARLDGLATKGETANVKQWGQTVFRSLVKNSGEAAFQSELFGHDAKSELVKTTGLAMMDVMLNSGTDKIDFAKVFTTKSLDAVMGAAMTTLGQYPELISKNEFVKHVIADVGAAVADTDLSKKELIPELSRLVLAKSADNLTALMNISEDNPEHLLVTATQNILQSLATKPEEGAWKPTFTKDQTSSLASALLDEVVQNPTWVTSHVAGNTLLSEVMDVTMASLKAIPAEKRFSAKTVQSLITVNVKAVAINQVLLKKFPVGDDGREQAALGYFLEGMFGYLYGDQKAMSQNMALAKTEVMEGTLERLLTDIAKQPITVSLIDKKLSLEFDGVENKWMSGFLNAIDGVSFEKGFQNAFFQQVAPEFMSSAINIANELAPGLSDDPKFQQLITVTSNGLAQALTERLQGGEGEAKQQDFKQWGNQLLKSLTWQAGELVLSSSSSFFGTGEAESALISNTGIALLKVVTQGDGKLKDVFKGDALDDVLEATLTTVSQYPNLFTSSEPIQKILSEITASVVDSGINSPGLIPEVLRITMEKTADNLDLIWSPDAGSSSNILAIATKNILSAIATPATEGKWKPRFSVKQTLTLTNLLVDEVIHNPVWVTSKIGEDTALSMALTETFKAMESIPADKRLHADSVQLLLTQSVKAVAVRKNLLDKIPGNAGEQESILNYAMDSLFKYMYGKKEAAEAQWGITKVQVANTVFEHFLNKLAIQPATKETVDANMQLLVKELDKATQNVEFDAVMFLKGFLG